MSTFFEKNIDQNSQKWFLFDAEGQTLGRMATSIATILRGKHKASYTPHVNGGDFVIVVNAEKIQLTGKKWTDKLYRDHSGFVGGLKTRTALEVLARHPEEIIERAVWGMLSKKGPLGKDQLTKLKIYVGKDHPHAAQAPQTWEDKKRTVRSAKSKPAQKKS